MSLKAALKKADDLKVMILNYCPRMSERVIPNLRHRLNELSRDCMLKDRKFEAEMEQLRTSVEQENNAKMEALKAQFGRELNEMRTRLENQHREEMEALEERCEKAQAEARRYHVAWKTAYNGSAQGPPSRAFKEFCASTSEDEDFEGMPYLQLYTTSKQDTHLSLRQLQDVAQRCGYQIPVREFDHMAIHIVNSGATAEVSEDTMIRMERTIKARKSLHKKHCEYGEDKESEY